MPTLGKWSLGHLLFGCNGHRRTEPLGDALAFGSFQEIHSAILSVWMLIYKVFLFYERIRERTQLEMPKKTASNTCVDSGSVFKLIFRAWLSICFHQDITVLEHWWHCQPDLGRRLSPQL